MIGNMRHVKGVLALLSATVVVVINVRGVCCVCHPCTMWTKSESKHCGSETHTSAESLSSMRRCVAPDAREISASPQSSRTVMTAAAANTNKASKQIPDRPAESRSNTTPAGRHRPSLPARLLGGGLEGERSQQTTDD